MNRKVLRDWLKAGYVQSGKLFPTEVGTPQGGIASPTIANIALDGLETVLTERFGSTATAINRLRVRLVRYADDFIITGSSKELLEVEVKPCVEAFLARRGLQLSQEKTRITHISEGFDFLGQNVREYDGKLLIKPSAKNIKAFLRSVREAITVNRSAKQETLIDLLNPMIRGWPIIIGPSSQRRRTRRWITTFSERYGVGHDADIQTNCQTGSRRKYFRTQGPRHWVFAT